MNPALNLSIGDKLCAMKTDSYSLIDRCPQCGEDRGVVCSKSQAQTGEPIKVYAVQCDHSWTLSQEASDRVREKSATINDPSE
jgi:hypothetical protein